MPDVNILPNLGKIIPFLKTQFGGKINKTSGITVKKILKIDNAAVAQANRCGLNYLCRI
jgi:hypothetical protein